MEINLEINFICSTKGTDLRENVLGIYLRLEFGIIKDNNLEMKVKIEIFKENCFDNFSLEIQKISSTMNL